MPKKIIRNKNGDGVFYFTQETEDAIVAYNNTEDMVQRNRLYETCIHEPFCKLAENNINTNTFAYVECDSDYTTIKDTVVCHLVKNLDKFRQAKGKAFSYFNISAKRFLIQWNNELYKKYCNQTTVEPIFHIGSEEDNFDVSNPHKELTVDERENIDLEEFFRLSTEYWVKNQKRIIKKPTDAIIMDAVLKVMNEPEFVDYKINKTTNKKVTIVGRNIVYGILKKITNHGIKVAHFKVFLRRMMPIQSSLLKEYVEKGTCKGDVY